MKHLFFNLLFLTGFLSLNAQNYPSGKSILDKIDANMSAKSMIMKSSMEITGSRATRTMEIKTWIVGDDKSFTEYLSPAREKGTKMLKLNKQLWIYSPSTDRTIQISGHMLRQSMMGSDMSYEDMMNDTPLQEQYKAEVTGEENIEGRKCWVVNLTSTVTDINYYSQKFWVDEERYVPLKMQQFAKSGKQLKEITLSDIRKVQGRWYPMVMIYKDTLKEGKGTRFTISGIQFDVAIPENVFNKGNLK
ncbi:MAG TPA: outer membrane lipoprotein-sorting protein [Paludibacteraceae bacterium]|nr:outer membrane lipoprotein-sorting protein [Paludibacteraceae bacterium]HPT42945.1 outer membrane lipoprotein-sorting protein [Paludibacteraceae bacterium]